MNDKIDKDIIQRYQIKRKLGKGAYGIVWLAVDKITRTEVALKKIFDAFQNQTDAQRTYREIIYLQKFQHHPNVIKLYSVHKSTNVRDIYLVFEYMETDLDQVVKKGGILKDIHYRYIVYQILKAVRYIHQANVIHRDLKPANILLNSQCMVKVADFGLARSVHAKGSIKIDLNNPLLTDYIATRWYRAPEILLASKTYDKAIDMWSIGCILAEMIIEKPIFPGASSIKQLDLIMHVILPTSIVDIAAMTSKIGYNITLERAVNSRRCPLRKILCRANDVAYDLVQKLLLFNPDKRITASEALNHPYFHLFKGETEHILLPKSIETHFSDDVQLSIDEYRNKLYSKSKSTENLTKNLSEKNKENDKMTKITPTVLRIHENSQKRNTDTKIKFYQKNQIVNNNEPTVLQQLDKFNHRTHYKTLLKNL